MDLPEKEVILPEMRTLPSAEKGQLHIQRGLRVLYGRAIKKLIPRVIFSEKAVECGEEGMDIAQTFAKMFLKEGNGPTGLLLLARLEVPFDLRQLALVEQP